MAIQNKEVYVCDMAECDAVADEKNPIVFYVGKNENDSLISKTMYFCEEHKSNVAQRILSHLSTKDHAKIFEDIKETQD